MSSTVANALLVLFFLLIGAFFAGSEIALVSLREGQVRALAQRGRRGQRVAALHADPNRFLAAVQIGVTLAGFMSAAFGASAFADDLSPVLRGWGLPGGPDGDPQAQDTAYWVSFVVVTLVITYLSLVVSELAPKRLALQRAEAFSLFAAPTLDRVAKMSRPVIWLLSRSTDVLVRVFGGDPTASREAISEEELRDIVAAHETLGREERQLIEDVFEAGDRQLHEVMVPRTEVDFLDASTPVYKAVRMSSSNPHSRYPVVRGSQDDVVGFVHVRDLFSPGARRQLGARGRDRPRGQADARHQAGALGHVGDAARGPPHGDRRWTSTAGPTASSRSRTCWRRSSARSTTSTTWPRSRPGRCTTATWRSTGCSTSRTSRTAPGSSCPRGPTRRWPASSSTSSAGCPSWTRASSRWAGASR